MQINPDNIIGNKAQGRRKKKGDLTEKCGLSRLSLRLTTVDCRVYVDDNHVIFRMI